MSYTPRPNVNKIDTFFRKGLGRNERGHKVEFCLRISLVGFTEVDSTGVGSSRCMLVAGIKYQYKSLENINYYMLLFI